MQWNSWNEPEGELSARERLIAILAFKIGTNISLQREDSVAELNTLPDEDIFAVLKMVALFTYWQQLTDAFQAASAPTLAQAWPQPTLQPYRARRVSQPTHSEVGRGLREQDFDLE